MAALNTITVTLRTRAKLDPGSMLLISGLVGALTNDTDAVPLGGNAAGMSLFGTTAVWRQRLGELALVAQKAVSSGVDSSTDSDVLAFDGKGPWVLNFSLLNPPHGQEPVTVSIQSRLFDPLLLDSPSWSTSNPDLQAGSGVVITPVAMSVVGDDNSFPLRVAFFTLAAMGQSTTSGARANTFTVTLRANVHFHLGSVVILSGLRNTGTNSTDALPISCYMKRPNMNKELRVNDFGYTAEWDRDNGTLEFRVFSVRTSANATYSISFALINPERGQDSPNIFLSVLMPGQPVACPLLEIAGNDTLVDNLEGDASPLCVSPDTWQITPSLVRNAAGDSSPLLVLDFLVKHVAQSTPSALASNTISVSLVFRSGVQAGSLLVVSGLTGTLTPDAHDLPLAVHVPVIYLQNSSIAQSIRAWNTSSGTCNRTMGPGWRTCALWTNADGSLKVNIQSSLLPHVPYMLQFSLQNPAAGQKPPPIAIQLSGASSIPKTAMESAEGNGAPLGVALFLAKMWQNVSISQSSPYPASRNTITVTIGLESRIYDMQSRITLSGLSGTDTPSGPIVINASDVVCSVNTSTTSMSSSSTPAPTSSSSTPYPTGSTSSMSGVGAETTTAEGSMGSTSASGTSGGSTPATSSPLSTTPPIATTPVIATSTPEPQWSEIRCGVQFAADWSSAADTDSLVLRFNSFLEPHFPYILSFEVRNQAAMQASPAISIELSGSIAVLRRQIRGALGNAAPLLIGGFSIKNLTQSSSTPGAVNSIFVTLSTNIVWPSSQVPGRTIVIAIQGLRGAQTTTAVLPMSETSARNVLGGNAFWTQASGLLEIPVLQHASLAPGETMSFSFKLVNPIRAHVSGVIIASAAIQDGEGPNVTLASPAEMKRATGHSAPLLVAGLLTTSIYQSSVAQSAGTCKAAAALSSSSCSRSSLGTCDSCSVNTISLSFATNVLITPPARITLQGLTGSLDVGLSALALTAQVTDTSPARSADHVSSKAPQDVQQAVFVEWDQSILSNKSEATEVFGAKAAAWNASSGILEIQVRQSMQPWALYEIQFELLNPHRAHDPVNVSLALSSLHHHIPARQLEGGSGNQAPLFVTGFTVKNISQLDPSPSSDNTITVVLAARSLLNRGDEIVIAGLTGSDTRSTDQLRIDTTWAPPLSFSTTPLAFTSSAPTSSTTISPTPTTAPIESTPPGFCAPGYEQIGEECTCTPEPRGSLFGVAACNQSGIWRQDTGQLRLTLNHDIAAHEEVSFSFSLLNPARGQDAPVVSVECVGRARILPSDMDSAQGNHAPLLVADFLVASISQDTPGALARNVLRLVVAVRAALPVGSVLHVSGLTGSESPDGFIDLEGNMTQYTTPQGVWQQAQGTLNITCAISVPPETLLVLHVPLLNGRHPQESPRVFLESSGPVRIAAAAMDKGISNAAPLVIAGLVARLFQSSYERSAVNELTLDFISSVNLPGNSTLALVNLLGAAPVSHDLNQTQVFPPALFSCVMPTNVRVGNFSRRREDSLADGAANNATTPQSIPATWSSSYQQVHMRIAHPLAAQQQYRLVFRLRNPASAQASPEVRIQVLGAIAVFEAPVLKPPAVPISSALRAPLAVVAELLNASILQTTPNAGALNTLRISFTSRDAIYTADRVNFTISGLRGAAAPVGTHVYIELGPGHKNLLAHVARWDRLAGLLVVQVTGDIEAGKATNFSFSVTNPHTGQDPQNVSLESSGLIHLPTPVAPAAENGAPLLVGHVRAASFRQSNPFVGASNVLQFSFSSNVWLPNTTLLSITGFANTSALVATGNSSAQALTVVHDASLLSTSETSAPGDAMWDSRAGLILVSLTADLVAHTRYGILIQVQNPLEAREGVLTSYVSAHGPIQLPLYNVSLGKGNMAPLFATGWQIKSIRQSSMATFGINTITVSLKMPAQILAGSKVIVSGLSGSITQSGPLEVHAQPDAVWLSTARWTNDVGRIEFELTADSDANGIYTLNFCLENPASGQSSPSPILLQTQDARGLEVIPRTEMTIPGGIHSPLVIAGFTGKTIWQSSSACNETNLISVTLVGLVPLDARYHTIVTIRGLTNSTTGGFNRKVPITAQPPVMGAYARWFQATGTLVLNLAEDSEGLPAHEALSVDFELGNSVLKRSVSRVRGEDIKTNGARRSVWILPDVRVEVTWRDEHGKMVFIDSTPLNFVESVVGSVSDSTCGFI
jgi:hypothetical protein